MIEQTIDTNKKLQALRSIVGGMESVLVAYSGGVDSAFLLQVSHLCLGDKAVGAIADSPSLPRQELEEALQLANTIGASVKVVQTRELENEAYRRNAQDRCYHCKNELFEHLVPLARKMGVAHVVYGANMDDLKDIRPGAQAAREHSIRAPLVEAELTKAEVRELSRGLGLPAWDKPSFACLSSRIPFGTEVTAEVLGRVEAAEDVMRALGFNQFRVRHHDNIARVEVGQDEIAMLLDPDIRLKVDQGLRAAGYSYVTLDLAGYRPGSMHEASRTIPLRLMQTG